MDTGLGFNKFIYAQKNNIIKKIRYDKPFVNDFKFL